MRVIIYKIGEDEPFDIWDNVVGIIPEDGDYTIIFADYSISTIDRKAYEIGVHLMEGRNESRN